MNGSRDGSQLPVEPADLANPASSSPRPPIALEDPITVVLVAKAAADLEITHERTNMSKTDIINRAVSLYEFIEAELRAGAQLIVRRDGRDFLVKLM
jgi:hypothetical protein